MSRGATEALVAQLADYERSDLSERTKAALRLADKLTSADPRVDAALYDSLRRQFGDDEILDLGMTITFASGWQRFIEAFGIVPDRWHDGAPSPWGGPDMAPQTPQRSGRPGVAGAPLDLPTS